MSTCQSCGVGNYSSSSNDAVGPSICSQCDAGNGIYFNTHTHRSPLNNKIQRDTAYTYTYTYMSC
jgi:hypothetical protein